MAPKKKLIPTAPPNRANALVSALLKNNSEREVYCANNMTDSWKYIDFMDPKTRLPCLALEWLYGSRGLLAGRVLKLQAKYGVGKSSFMWLMYACGQMKHNAWCYHMETEAAPPPPDFIASFGCDPTSLAIGQPKSLEESFALIDETIATIRGGFGGGVNEETGRMQKTKFTDPLDAAMESPIMIGFDSISAVDTEAKAEADVMDMTKTSAVAIHSRKISEWFRSRSYRLKATQSLLMMTAQEKANIKTGGANSFTPGPQKETSTIADATIGFHSTWIMSMVAYPYWDKALGANTGERITVTIDKNKISPKNRKLDLFLIRDKGFDLLKTDADFLIGHAATEGLIEASRHSHGITCKALQDKSFKDELEFLQAFYANESMLQEVREKLRIRGFGFDFERDYAPTEAEVEDNTKSAESDINGLAGKA